MLYFEKEIPEIYVQMAIALRQQTVLRKSFEREKENGIDK